MSYSSLAVYDVSKLLPLQTAPLTEDKTQVLRQPRPDRPYRCRLHIKGVRQGSELSAPSLFFPSAESCTKPHFSSDQTIDLCIRWRWAIPYRSTLSHGWLSSAPLMRGKEVAECAEVRGYREPLSMLFRIAGAETYGLR